MMRFRTVPNEAFVGLFTARLDMLQALATWKAKANLDNDGASVLRRFIDQVGSVPGLEGAYPQCAALLEIALHMGDWIRDVKAAQHDAEVARGACGIGRPRWSVCVSPSIPGNARGIHAHWVIAYPTT